MSTTASISTAPAINNIANVSALLDWATNEFTKCGFTTPRLEIELLLAYATNRTRVQLHSHPEETLTPEQLRLFLHSMKRRLMHEPSAYITGSKAFYAGEFAVSQAVLIPRPETELLVDNGIEWLRQHNTDRPLRVLELGTGSGCIAISLIQHVGNVSVIATDISPQALRVADENAASLLTPQQRQRLQLIEQDGLSSFIQQEPFDLIISNPPYIPSKMIDTLAPDVRNFEPRLALDGGSDGLQIIRKIIIESGGLLRRGGALMLEFGYGQMPAVANLLAEHFPGSYTFFKDLAGIHRCLVAIKEDAHA